MTVFSTEERGELKGKVDALRPNFLAVLNGNVTPSEKLVDLVRVMGEGGLLAAVTTDTLGGSHEIVSTARLCFLRETLGHISPLVDLAFAMQGLGSYPMTHAFLADSKGASIAQTWLPKVVRGSAVAAFALTEQGAGSDLSRITTSAHLDGDAFVLTGEKVFISNAGIADVYVVFAVTDPDAPSSRRLSAFVVPADSDGLSTESWRVLGGHPIGAVHFDEVRLPRDHLIGERGRGLGLALATLGRFRTTVGAAAVGFAQRALDEAVSHVTSRHQFGAALSELDVVRSRLGDMECLVQSARLMVERAAQLQDDGAPREVCSKWSSMAKLTATENAQKVVDQAVQLHGGKGVLESSQVAQLYDDVRGLRIYEGASDIQRVLIARAVLSEHKREMA